MEKYRPFRKVERLLLQAEKAAGFCSSRSVISLRPRIAIMMYLACETDKRKKTHDLAVDTVDAVDTLCF